MSEPDSGFVTRHMSGLAYEVAPAEKRGHSATFRAVPADIGVPFDEGQWSEKTIAALRTLWNHPATYSTLAIGEYLGISKNAIVGKSHRLDLPTRPSPIKQFDPATMTRPSRSIPRTTGPTLPPLASAVQEVSPDGEDDDFEQADDDVRTPNGRKLDPRHLRNASEPKFDPDGAAPYDRALAQRAVARRMSAAVRTTVKGATLAGDHTKMPPPECKTEPRLVLAMRPEVVEETVFKPRRSTPCAWPIGEPGTRAFRSCDKPSEPGRSYCAACRSIAFVRVRDRTAPSL